MADLRHQLIAGGIGQVSKLAVMIRIRVNPGRRDERRSLRGEHLRARAKVDPAQELYLVLDDAADDDVVHMFDL